jgi:gamma-carbonic anhydrase
MTHRDVSIIPINGKSPTIHPSAFIAPGCRIIGDVTIGPDVSIWYNCVLRADVSHIRIGARSNIQDGSIIHCDGPMPHRPEGYPTIIGEDVLIGHLAMIHGCILDDRAFVGLKATVMNGGQIGSDAMLAAGALLTEHKEIPARELWAGTPARRVREIDDAMAAGMQAGVAHYVLNGRIHKDAVGDI